ncbi:MAG: hybrid sensor histidine kinase/response regulator [Desulfobacterales bacterium]
MNSAMHSGAPKGLFQSLGRRSISKELTISLVLVVFLIEGLLLGVVYTIQRRAHFRDLNLLADSYSDNLAEVLAIPLWDFDDEQIARIGNGYLRNPTVAEIRIEDAGGEVLFQKRKGAAVLHPIVRHAGILHKDQVLGRVDLYLSPDGHSGELAWLRNVMALSLMASLIVILGASGVLLRILMRKPLSILKHGIDRVAHGDYDYGFEKVHHSELSDIARRFSGMADTVRQREQSLQLEIAERKRAEGKIRESEARSRALLDAIPDLIFRFDRRGTFLGFKGDRTLLSSGTDQLLGRTIDEVLSPEPATLMLQRLEETFRSGRIQEFETTLEVNGEKRYFENRIVAISSGQAMAIVRDITGQKLAATEREWLEDKLRRAQKMEAIGMLAGGVAHDLNNVLSGLVSYPQLLLMDLPKDHPLQKPILTIQKSGEKAANIVQDLLTLARRGVAVREVVNLNRLVREFFESPEFDKLKFYNPDFELSLDLDDQLLNVTGSPVHFSKTIMNLVSNAVEALDAKGTVRVRTENRYIDRPVRGYEDIVPGDYVILAVSDDGIGISPEDINRIFEPFYTKKVMGRSGTGLGMAVVWSTVKDHQGYIDVKSGLGTGTRITVYLPASRQEVVEPPCPESIHRFGGRGETILVVDDMPEQLEIASQMLGKLGYRVCIAPSGREAVEILRKQSADLVILDMIMEPGMDGLETYRQITSIRPGQKAVIASGYSETERVREAQALGAGAYIKKPYLLEKIGMAVREALDE